MAYRYCPTGISTRLLAILYIIVALSDIALIEGPPIKALAALTRHSWFFVSHCSKTWRRVSVQTPIWQCWTLLQGPIPSTHTRAVDERWTCSIWLSHPLGSLIYFCEGKLLSGRPFLSLYQCGCSRTVYCLW